MKLRLYRLFKMFLGFMVGMLISAAFGLYYVYTAGVIAVLSLEPTRKVSLENGIVRVIDSLLALVLATVLFLLLGFHLWVLFVFVALLIPLSFLLKLDKGIVVALVLVSQIYLEQNLRFSINALFILLIGVGVAFLLNLYMPKNEQITTEIKLINQHLNGIIQNIANEREVSFTEIDNLLKNTYNNIQLELENINLPLTTKRLKYIEMRIEQVSILKRVNRILNEVKPIKEKEYILDLLKEFENKIGEENFALILKERLDTLLLMFKESSLPENREMFENRAKLYYVLLEVDQFLNIKLAYHKNI